MNPIDSLFARLRENQQKAFIPFLPAGDPDLEFTVEALRRIARAGASLIEVGFPFSDPIADGPVIQASYTRALAKKIRLAEVFEAIGSVTRSEGWNTPMVGMVSYSLVYRSGIDHFLSEAHRAGLLGLIVPDLPIEEADELVRKARDHDLKLILMVTPTTSKIRAKQIVAACSGFVYCVSVVGITGERDRLPEALTAQLSELRSMTDLPLCVGFGVSKPEHVQQLRDIADGVIVGSALVRRLEKVPDHPREAILAEIEGLVRELAQALNSA